MFDDGLVYLNLSLLMEKILGSFWIPAITILQLWRDLPLQFTYSETCHFLRLLGVWPTVKPHTCTYLLYGQKHPCCFSLPPLTDTQAPNVMFFFLLSSSSLLSSSHRQWASWRAAAATPRARAPPTRAHDHAASRRITNHLRAAGVTEAVVGSELDDVRLLCGSVSSA